MRYSPTAKPSSSGLSDRGSRVADYHIWDNEPELMRDFLASLRLEPGSCRALLHEAEWSAAELGSSPKIILAAPDPNGLPWEALMRLRSEFKASFLLILPTADARLWWRLTRRGFRNVLTPPFASIDLNLEFADWEARAPLAQRLPELEARLHSKLDFSFPANLKYVSPAAGFISRLAREHGFHPRVWSENLPLALGEALANAVEHGCRGDASMEVRVEVRIEHDVLKVRIEDEGSGFDTASLPDPHSDEGLLIGSGRGVMLMRALVDRVAFEDGGRVVALYARRMPPPE